MRLITICLLISLFGCMEYIEIDREMYPKLAPQLKKAQRVDLVSTIAGEDPEDWRGIYRNIFPLNDQKRIEKIIQLIKKAEPFDAYTDRNLTFKVNNKIYFLGIGWDSEIAYGHWWKSKDLLDALESWGLEHPKGKQDLPKGSTDLSLPQMNFE